jgi:cytochrome c-type biogenesis protein CcsB
MTIAAGLLVAMLVSLLATLALSAVSAAIRLAAPARVASGPQLGTPSILLRTGIHAGLLVSLALGLATLGARVTLTGHAPWSNLHEFSQAFAVALLGAYLLLARRMPIGGLAALVALVAAVLVAYALTLPDEVLPLVPALQAPLLLTVHVGAAMLAYAISGVAFVAAVAELIQRRTGGRIAMLPSTTIAAAAAHRSVVVAFPILTLAILLGSVWANLAWRSYWNNDPKELAAAATWLVYAAYLHISVRRDRWADYAPWLLVLGFAAVLFTFLGAGLLFVGQHSYAAS